MDFFTGLVIAGLIGHSIWEALKESPEEKRIREREERIQREQLAAEEERERKRWEAEEAEREERQRPFETSLECFQKQYVSYARIATYNSCPRRFKLIYLDKNGREGFGDRSYRGGRGFHIVMEAYLAKHVGCVISSLEYNEVIRGRRWYFSEAWGEERKKRRRRVRFTCRTFPKDVEIVAIEKELSFKVNNIQFYGIVDLVLKYPDGSLEIVDYKTGTRLPVKEQLEIYSIPFTQYNDLSKVDFRVICPDRQSHYRWSLDREEMAERRNHILGIVNTIINDSDFAPAISSACLRCSVGYACKYSENYKKTKRVSGKNNRLTRLNLAYEWKHGVKPPKIVGQRSKSHKDKTNKRRGRGLSYSLSQAKSKYECFKTRRPIQVGEYHFVNHSGKRFSIDAFAELYPERAKQLMEKRKQDSVPKKRKQVTVAKRRDQGLSYSMCRAKGEYKCHHTERHIHIGEYNFVNHHGKRLCVDAFKELYPEKAKQLKEVAKEKDKKPKCD